MNIDMNQHAGPGPVPGPGFYRMPAAVYHDDPAPAPSMSSGLIKHVLTSPKHAHAEHPRLSKNAAQTPAELAAAAQDEEDEAKPDRVNIGSVAHELLLGHGAGFHVVEARDWRTKAAKEERDNAIASGAVPILARHLRKAERIVDAITANLVEVPEAEGALDSKAREVVGVWHDDVAGIWGRVMVDLWSGGGRDIWDIKTSESALTDSFIERQIADSLAARAAWYMRGVTQLVPDLAGRLNYRLIFAEQQAPFEVRVVELTPEQLALGARKAMHAAVLFGHCLRTGTWPGFPRRVSTVSSKPWVEADWMMREQVDPLFSPVADRLLLALSPYAPPQRDITL